LTRKADAGASRGVRLESFGRDCGSSTIVTAHSNLGDRTGTELLAVADQASVLRGGLAV
jgi:hypothetical protein